jgi:hypothetical protein
MTPPSPSASPASLSSPSTPESTHPSRSVNSPRDIATCRTATPQVPQSAEGATRDSPGHRPARPLAARSAAHRRCTAQAGRAPRVLRPLMRVVLEGAHNGRFGPSVRFGQRHSPANVEPSIRSVGGFGSALFSGSACQAVMLLPSARMTHAGWQPAQLLAVLPACGSGCFIWLRARVLSASRRRCRLLPV